MRRFGVLVAATVLWALPCAAVAAGIDLHAGAGRLGGDTTYAIGGSISDNLGASGELWFPISELAWPLDVWMGTVGADAALGPLSLSVGLSMSLTGDAGEMEDSDWGVFFALSEGNPYFRQDSKDVFSTSTADLDATVFDVRGRFRLLSLAGLSLSGGAGWLYEKFDFEASDLVQYSPSAFGYGLPLDPFAAAVGGVAITYEVTYSIPYLEVAGQFGLGERFALEARLAWSPLAKAEDRDDHVLRFKLSEGDCEGTALMAGIAARLHLAERWFLLFSFDYLSVDTEGTQRQRYYAGELAGYAAEIDQEITSSQHSFFVEGGFSF